MAQIQIILSNDSGTSTTVNGTITDPEVIAAAMTVIGSLTAAAASPTGQTA